MTTQPTHTPVIEELLDRAVARDIIPTQMSIDASEIYADMLLALKAVRMYGVSINPELSEQVNKAIAKAEGK